LLGGLALGDDSFLLTRIGGFVFQELKTGGPGLACCTREMVSMTWLFRE